MTDLTDAPEWGVPGRVHVDNGWIRQIRHAPAAVRRQFFPHHSNPARPTAIFHDPAGLAPPPRDFQGGPKGWGGPNAPGAS